MCGDPFGITPVLPRIHLAWPVTAEGGVILRGVEMVEGVPVGWLRPRHDGAVEDPIVRVKRCAGGNGGS